MSQQLQKQEPTTVQSNVNAGAEPVQSRRAVSAAVDIFESKNDVWLVADLPGVAKQDLHLEAKDGEIAFRGTPKGADVDYARAFRLPPGVDVEAISAELKDGVLTLRLPKPPAMKPRVISVN
jgi:HSP20 family protein